LFGALRIYGQHWNYNGGLYHWLEVAVSGYSTPGPVPVDVVGWRPILVTKLIAAGILGMVLVGVLMTARPDLAVLQRLRLALVPLGAYLLLTTTVHPWYVTGILPLLPFLVEEDAGGFKVSRWLWPWLYLSAAVSLSYLTYRDPANLREYDWVRFTEYLPAYLLLLWASWPAIAGARGPATD
jgi:hypothetical protein